MAYFDSHPTERSHSNAWTVVDGKKFYTPRDLLRQAAPRAGWRIRDEEIPRVEAKWREHLVALDFHVSGFGLGSVADNDPPKPELSRRTKPRPADISAENVRAAARVWDKGRGFKNFGVAKKFQVWIDAAGDDVLTPYPVKAIVALAARDAGRRPLRTDEFAGADNGPWHRQLKKLGFPVLPIAVSPNGAVAIPVVLKGAQRGSRRAASLSANELKDTLKQGEKVLAPKDPTDAAIERLLKRGRLPTEAKRQVRARLGQGTFRSALLAAYGECALTGETVREVLPSMATMTCENNFKSRHRTTKRRQTLRMPVLLSLRKSAIVLKSGASRPVSHISSMLRWHSRSSRRLDWTRLR